MIQNDLTADDFRRLAIPPYGKPFLSPVGPGNDGFVARNFIASHVSTSPGATRVRTSLGTLQAGIMQDAADAPGSALAATMISPELNLSDAYRSVGMSTVGS